MGEILEFLLGLGILLLFVWYISSGIKAMRRMGTERKVYAKMINNISDTTVMSYIDAFEKSYGFLSGIINSNKAVAHRNDLTRQAQGWEIIKNSNKVSEETKEKLKNAFISRGVPLKNI